MYVAACYPVGTGMCHNIEGLLQHYVSLMVRIVLQYSNNTKYFQETSSFAQTLNGRGRIMKQTTDTKQVSMICKCHNHTLHSNP